MWLDLSSVFLRCVFDGLLYVSSFSPLTSPPIFSSTNVSMSSLIWKWVNTVHIDEMLSPAQLSGAQLCSGVDQQPGLSSVRAEAASEVAHASFTVQFTLSKKMEKNRTSHTVTDTIIPTC